MKLSATVIVLCFFSSLCLAQVNATPAANPLTQAGTDSFGRPVQPSASPVPQPAPVPQSDRQEFQQNIKDVYFDFNRSNLRSDDQATLQHDAEWLKSHPDVAFTIEGDADTRGSIAYNLFLSDERALAVRDELTKLGVPNRQILFASGWGKLYPVCQQEDEGCWSQQRRAHMAPWSAEAAPASNAQVWDSGDSQLASNAAHH